jgi:DNA (cytosine-5)-methyltransferase 1
MTQFTFFDFCSGIGAGHTALTRLGGQCVGFAEINPKSEITYRKIHQANENELKNWGDLTKIKSNEVPDFDLMVGGFPCQSFSIVGQRKGMEDERGQVIFSLARILKEKRTKFFLLENVKGLVNHDQGRTIVKVIELLHDAGYKLSWKVLKSSDYGVPQIRERVYFIGIREDLAEDDFEFLFPEHIENSRKISEFLIDEDPSLAFNEELTAWKTFMKYLNNKYNIDRYNLDEILSEDYLILDTRQSDLRLYRNECPTLRTGRHGILYVKNGKLRRLSGKESLLLQGFDLRQAERAAEISQTDLLSQAGNAFTVNVIQEIGKEMIQQMPFGAKLVPARPRPKKPSQAKLKLLTEPAYEF